MLNVTAKYDITNWLNFQLRGNMDKINDVDNRKYYVGTAVAYGGVNGGYSILDMTNTLYYGDALLNFIKSYGKIKVNALLGTSITDSRINGESAGSTLFGSQPQNLVVTGRRPWRALGDCQKRSIYTRPLKASHRVPPGFTTCSWLLFITKPKSAMKNSITH